MSASADIRNPHFLFFGFALASAIRKKEQTEMFLADFGSRWNLRVGGEKKRRSLQVGGKQHAS